MLEMSAGVPGHLQGGRREGVNRTLPTDEGKRTTPNTAASTRTTVCFSELLSHCHDRRPPPQ